jgi:hypothetical protein
MAYPPSFYHHVCGENSIKWFATDWIFVVRFLVLVKYFSLRHLIYTNSGENKMCTCADIRPKSESDISASSAKVKNMWSSAQLRFLWQFL